MTDMVSRLEDELRSVLTDWTFVDNLDNASAYPCAAFQMAGRESMEGRQIIRILVACGDNGNPERQRQASAAEQELFMAIRADSRVRVGAYRASAASPDGEFVTFEVLVESGHN